MTRGEAQQVLAGFLMERVRADHHPSVTQMKMIEEMLPQEMVPEYLDVLLEKVAADNWPSIDMLRRLQRVAGSLPAYEQND